MSIESVNEFLARVESDEQIQSELAQVIESADGEDATDLDQKYKDGASDLGKKYGYNFTSEELWAEIKQRQDQFEQRQNSEELSDEELEAIAGGSVITVAVIGAVSSITVAAINKCRKW